MSGSVERVSVAPGSLEQEYELGEVLGVGTVGTIYRAVDRQTGQKVAIKKLHPTVSESTLIRARFRREMEVLQRMRHPNIIRYYRGGEDNGLLFYAMELVEGGTVKELLQARGSLSWPVVVDITRQVCSALQFAHNHGVVHRDLKPGNLFLTREGDVKLGDFGIARDLHGTDLTSSGMTVGTHAYMAPEQITGDTSLTGKADLYSLGCCMFEMLVGRKPFHGDNYAQLFDQHLRADPPRIRLYVPDCPEMLEQIVLQLLAKKPEDRPFNARKVQGVMLQLDERVPLAGDPPLREDPTDEGRDVAAAGVTYRGHYVLQQQIQQSLESASVGEVSWARLAVVLAVIVVVVAAAAVLGR